IHPGRGRDREPAAEQARPPGLIQPRLRFCLTPARGFRGRAPTLTALKGPTPMDQPQVVAAGPSRRLVALNVALLALLGLVTVAARAERSGQPAVRGRGDYTVVGGK